MLKRRSNEQQSADSAPNMYSVKREVTNGGDVPQQDYSGTFNQHQHVMSTQQRQFTYNIPIHSEELNRGSGDSYRTAATLHRQEVEENFADDAPEAFDETAFEGSRLQRSRASSMRRLGSQRAESVANSEFRGNGAQFRGAGTSDINQRSPLSQHAAQTFDLKTGNYVMGMAQPNATFMTNMNDAQAYTFNGVGLGNMMLPGANYVQPNISGNGNFVLPSAVNIPNGGYMFPSGVGMPHGVGVGAGFVMPPMNLGVPYSNVTMRAGALPTENSAVAVSLPAAATVQQASVVQLDQPQQVPVPLATASVRVGQQAAAAPTGVVIGKSAPQQQRPNAETLRSLPRGPASPELFERIRKYCRDNSMLYEDPEFPATNESLFNASSDPQATSLYRDVQWLRPTEIVKIRAAQGEMDGEASLFVKGVDRFDLVQGALGNCWVLAAIAAFCERQELLQQVIPSGQSFSPDWYAGVFRFRFARLGEWRDVIVDDRLPTRDGRLVFLHSSSSNEFWGSLLEKAYAKLAACYANLDGGRFEDAMVDFTDGLAEDFELPAIRNDPAAARRLETIMLDAFNRDSIMCAGIDSHGNMQAQTLADSSTVGKDNVILANGLVVAHAYTITNVQSIIFPYSPTKPTNNRLCLVRVRNPWGNNVEWNGAFSDNSPEWQQVAPDFRRKFDIQAADGEFWMTLKDFIDNFDRASLCHLAPNLSSVAAKRWQTRRFKNHWIKGLNAGGRPFLKETHCSNPQYHITLSDDGHSEHTILVDIQQPDIRHLQSGATSSTNRELMYKPIGFVIYRAPPNATFPLPKDYIRNNTFVARCDNFVTSRSYAKRFALPTGDYVIVPCTADANVELEFFLQVYSERSCLMKDQHISGETSIPADNVHDRVEKVAPLSEKHKDTIQARFIRLAGNANGDLPAHLIPALLKNIPISGFPQEVPIELAKTLVHYVSDSSGLKLTLKDTYRLVQIMLDWCNMFREFDKDQSTTLDASEMQSLLGRLGYSLDMAIIKQLVLRYCDEKGQLDLINSLFCIAKLSSVSKIFAEHAPASSGSLTGESQVSFTLKSLLTSVALM